MPRQRIVLVAEHIPAPYEAYQHAPQVDVNVLIEHAEFIVKCHSLWRELHSKQNPTPEWFADWVKRVPNFGCGCRNWLREYIKNNPPTFGEDFYEWTIRLHDAVSAKVHPERGPWDRVS